MKEWDEREKKRTEEVKNRLNEILKNTDRVLSDLNTNNNKITDLLAESRKNIEEMNQLQSLTERQILEGEKLRTKILEMLRDFK